MIFPGDGNRTSPTIHPFHVFENCGDLMMDLAAIVFLGSLLELWYFFEDE